MQEIKKVNEAKWDEDANGKRWEDYETILCPDGTVIDMVKLIDEQYKAMAAINHTFAHLRGLVSKLKFVYTFRVKTQATDGFNIYVNPQFTNGLDFTGKVFVMLHELLHCVLNHMRRGQGHDHNRSNIAADYEVNATIAALGTIKVSTMEKLRAYIDMKYKDMGYETIYDLVKKSDSNTMNNDAESSSASKNSDQSEQGDGDGNGGSGSGSGDGSGDGSGGQNYSDDYKAGWAQAIADYEAGNISI